MYYPHYLTKLTKLADSPALPSLGTVNGGALLALLKRHAALPSDSTWTEADVQLSAYLDIAEAVIEKMTGTPYRSHSYMLEMATLQRSVLVALPIDISGYWLSLPVAKFTAVRLPVYPVTASSVTFSWIDDDGNAGSFVNGTDFVVKGAGSRSPELVFMSNITWPYTGLVPYPFTIQWTSPGTSEPAMWESCLLQYATYLYRNPEGMGQEVAAMGQHFWGLVSLLSGTFL
jgi:hypothetical protein